MTEVLTGTERVLHTPLPAAYSILISQITWIYVLMLPFQLYSALNWVTIPGTMIASYIILGLAAIGGEIENPFGRDVNDLPLDNYCQELASELDIIMSAPAPNPEIFMKKPGNLVLFPLSKSGAETWGKRDIEDIRAALKTKAVISGRNRSRANSVVF
jgi:putative membrane protein